MNEPWGIPGPEFLRIYLVGLAFALLFALAVRIHIRSGSADTRSARSSIRPGQLTLDELAYLAGGPRRVVETAVVRLIDRGRLRPSRAGAVRVVEGATGTHPVDRAVLADAARYGDRTVGLLVDKVSRDDSLRRIADVLVSKGLLVGEAAARTRWCVLPLAVLFVVGGARWANGLAEGRPIGWLTVALIGTALIGVLLYRKSVPETTYAGRRVLAEARHERGDAVPSEESALLVGAAGAVALGGMAGHPDPEMATALETQRQVASNSGSAGSCAGAGSSGGDGGGSSCGGGGGCGGGGCGG